MDKPVVISGAQARMAETIPGVAPVLEIIDLLSGSCQLAGCLVSVLKVCRDNTAADLAVFLHQRADGTGISAFASDPEFDLSSWKLNIGGLRRPSHIRDLSRVAWRAQISLPLRRFRTMMSAPVIAADEELMVIVLLADKPDALSAGDRVFLDRVGRLMEHAVDMRRLTGQTEVLGGVPNSAPVTRPDISGDLDMSFTALSRAYDRATDWQGKIVDITNDLLSSPTSDVDQSVSRALASTGELAGSDRTYVFRLRPPDRLDNTHEWVAPGIEPMIDLLQDQPDSLLTVWRDDLEAGRAVYLPEIDALPAELVVKEVLQMQGIQSLLVVPMLRDERLTGFVGYDAVRARRRFTATEIQLLMSVANAINVVIERAAAEAAAASALEILQHERDMLQATLAALPDLVIEVDRDGRFVAYNEGGSLPPAIPREAFLGCTPEDILPPNEAALMRDIMREVDRVGRSEGRAYKLVIEGVTRWFLTTAAAKSQNGGRNGYVFVIREITHRRKQESQILRLSKIAELTSNMVIVTDVEERIEWVNPAFEARSGWSLHEVLGRKPASFLSSGTADAEARKRIRAALFEGKPVQAELLNRSRSSEEYWISKDIQPLRDETGALVGFVAVQTDITELKLSQQRAVRELAIAMEGSIDAMGIISADGHYRYMNRAHRRLFDIRETEDVSGLQWRDFTAPEEFERFMRHEFPIYRKQGHWRGQMRGSYPDGKLMLQEMSLNRTENGDTLYILQDITDRLLAEQEQARLREELQLAQRRETVAHIASGIAHDLNNLVAVVSGTASLFEAQCAGDPELMSGIDRIRRASNAARDLVGGLGRLGRPDKPKAQMDLRKLVSESVELLGSARIHRHAVTVDLPEDARPAWANSTEIVQVVVNLALNACEAEADEAPVVSLAVLPAGTPPPARDPDAGQLRPDMPHVLFTVTNTGHAVEPEVRARLFERYFTTKGKSGTGLGLPIVAAILRDNDAALWFDSEVGVGTTVTVAWPSVDVRPAARPAVAAAEAEASDVDLDGVKVLVVDDVADVADVLAEMLETAGAIAISVADPAEALDLLQENPGLWSALVTDLHMAEPDGIGLARAAAVIQPPVPAVLVTALPQSVGADAGSFVRVLAKPVDAVDLIAAVRAAVGRAAVAEEPLAP